MSFKRIAVDTSKAIFTVHGIDEADRPVLRRDFTRARFEAFITTLEPTTFALEACGAAHHWGRQLQAHGHRVLLIPPQYVKPFVKPSLNDRADAQAISEAAGRPGMSVVPVRSLDAQSRAVVLRVRERLVHQRTQFPRAIRGHAAEFGIVGARGPHRVADLMQRIRAGSEVPATALRELERLSRSTEALDSEVAEIDQELADAAKAHEVARRLMGIPGIGPIGATTLMTTVDAARFESGRHFAAWLGLVPREHSSGGKHRLGGISKASHQRLRQLLVLGATTAIRHARPGSLTGSPWLLALLERKPRKLAACALANKMARIVWAMTGTHRASAMGSRERGTVYRRHTAMA